MKERKKNLSGHRPYSLYTCAAILLIDSASLTTRSWIALHMPLARSQVSTYVQAVSQEGDQSLLLPCRMHTVA
jgi:hypothetical protein